MSALLRGLSSETPPKAMFEVTPATFYPFPTLFSLFAFCFPFSPEMYHDRGDHVCVFPAVVPAPTQGLAHTQELIAPTQKLHLPSPSMLLTRASDTCTIAESL